MKYFIYKVMSLLLLVSMVCLLGSCDRDYLRYDTTSQDAIPVVNEDSLFYTFVEGQTEAIHYPIHLALIGMTRDYDREIAIDMLEMNTAQRGIHYDLPERILFVRDTTATDINLKLYPYVGLMGDTVQLFLTLKENENFRLLNGADVRNTFRLFITMQPVSAPEWWYDRALMGTNTGEMFLGPYSAELYYRFMQFFHKMEDLNPTSYQMIVEEFGEDLDYYDFWMLYGLWDTYEIPLQKYVVRPLYDYYYNEGLFTEEELEDKGIKIPEPNY